MTTTLPATAEPNAKDATDHERIRANAWGKYYVTGECNGCGVCAWCAPQNFGTTFDRAYFAVMHQPVGESEREAVEAAVAACPLHCIHDDGETD